MEKVLRFLVLTDHRVHHDRNPIYSLLPTLRAHPHTALVDVASRGNPKNDPFFKELQPGPIHVGEVGEDFSFDAKGKAFLCTYKKAYVPTYDAVLMRLPRPVKWEFMEFLSQWDREVLFINHPLGIEKTSNKAYLLNFPSLCPPMKLCYRRDDILTFAKQFPIVLKPLKEYGGKGILKVDGEFLYEGSQEHFASAFLDNQRNYIQEHGYLAMKFMKHVGQGDKRIIIVNGKVLGASLRLPPQGSWLCNVAQGGTSIASKITPEEQFLVEQLSPKLEKEGVLIAGIDTLMGDMGKRVLSEINTLSVGGFLNLQEQSGKPILDQFVQILIEYVNHKTRKSSGYPNDSGILSGGYP